MTIEEQILELLKDWFIEFHVFAGIVLFLLGFISIRRRK
jgi:hypothetical protein